MPRTIAIGDIHGCHIALETMIDRLELSGDDTIVLLGDVVDRGPDTSRCFDLLADLHCQLVYVLGNHEEMMIEALAGHDAMYYWLAVGGEETIHSYGGRRATIEDIPYEHLKLLESGVFHFESETDIFTHAAIDPGLPLAEQTESALRWQRFYGHERPHCSGKRVLCGHTPQSEGLPAVIPGWVCLDTLAYMGLWLTALDTSCDDIYQTNQEGESRGPLSLDEIVGEA